MKQEYQGNTGLQRSHALHEIGRINGKIRKENST
jgi:hypothetical protein